MKHTVLMLIAAVLLISLAAARTNSSASAQRHAGDEEPAVANGWEYLVVSGGNVNLTSTDNSSLRKESGAFAREWFPLEKNLDRLGAKGWELVSVSGPPQEPIYYFKRKK